MNRELLLEIEDLEVRFPERGRLFRQRARVAVDGVSCEIYKGEVLGLVGESGSGKSTLGRTLLGLREAHRGRVMFEGHDILSLGRADTAALRRRFQIVFQDPYSSLNPRKTVGSAVFEVLRHVEGLSTAAASSQTDRLFESVGIDPRTKHRYPHEFSGGQRQRVAIARALATQPEFIVCDEAVSALDVSIQAQILNLLLELKAQNPDLTLLFISHALNVVKHVSDRVAVMKDGRIIELRPTDELFNDPETEYTKRLVSLLPTPIVH
ncbi:ATP-binding cassette domain-containing protein [Paenarthrobacter sp. NPDC089675]|uniref:ATP-binding cassette domain-containing protein n=1 Tax=Paenarthrobacter sp. NPDC089675 TaxID=3364376 RepID=UPI003806F8CA